MIVTDRLGLTLIGFVETKELAAALMDLFFLRCLLNRSRVRTTHTTMPMVKGTGIMVPFEWKWC